MVKPMKSFWTSMYPALELLSFLVLRGSFRAYSSSSRLLADRKTGGSQVKELVEICWMGASSPASWTGPENLRNQTRGGLVRSQSCLGIRREWDAGVGMKPQESPSRKSKVAGHRSPRMFTMSGRLKNGTSLQGHLFVSARKRSQKLKKRTSAQT